MVLRQVCLSSSAIAVVIVVVVFISFIAPGFLYFWGIVFLVTTSLVMVLKREEAGDGEDGDLDDQGIVDTYRLLWKIVNLRAVKSLIAILLTVKV